MSENIFADEWRECLRAHYMHVVRTEDRVTLPSLTIVMHQAGFTDSELAELRVRATMYADHVDADFKPDLKVLGHPEVLETGKSPVFAVLEVPEVAPPEALSEDELLAGDDLEPEDEIEPVIEELPVDDPDQPQQLSLF
jgi:hypothetical protein